VSTTKAANRAREFMSGKTSLHTMDSGSTMNLTGLEFTTGKMADVSKASGGMANATVLVSTTGLTKGATLVSMTMRSKVDLVFTAGLTTDFTRDTGKKVNRMVLQKLKCSRKMVRIPLNEDIPFGNKENAFRHLR
jgi:hypothetical protein